MSLSDAKFMRRKLAGMGEAPQESVDLAALAGIGRLTSTQAFDLLAGLDLTASMAAAPRVSYLDESGTHRYAWLVGEKDGQSVLRVDDLTTVVVPSGRVAQLDRDLAAEEKEEEDIRAAVRESREAAARGDVTVLHISAGEEPTLAMAFDAGRGTPQRALIERLAAAELGDGYKVADVEIVSRGRLCVRAQAAAPGPGPLGTHTVRSVQEITDAMLHLVEQGDSDAVRMANRSIGFYFQTSAPAQLARQQSMAYRDLLGAALALANKLPDWGAISKKVTSVINIAQPGLPAQSAPPPPGGPSLPGFDSGRFAAWGTDAEKVETAEAKPKGDPHAEEQNHEHAPTTAAVAAGVRLSGPMQFGNELEFSFDWDADLWADATPDKAIKLALVTQLRSWLTRSARRGPMPIAAGAIEVRDFDRSKRKAILTAFTAQRVRAPEGGRDPK